MTRAECQISAPQGKGSLVCTRLLFQMPMMKTRDLNTKIIAKQPRSAGNRERWASCAALAVGGCRCGGNLRQSLIVTHCLGTRSASSIWMPHSDRSDKDMQSCPSEASTGFSEPTKRPKVRRVKRSFAFFRRRIVTPVKSFDCPRVPTKLLPCDQSLHDLSGQRTRYSKISSSLE